MDAALLEILCCPATHQALHAADGDALAHASARSGKPLEEGLLREDGKVLYPVINGIPILLAEEGIIL
ncbi:MAG TPA: hypothetical protein PLS03_09285 [Terrimicrobiaceae bacterium]|nr:hypothetical protein [Terrimicrobiaceae bacterium]